MDVDPTPPAPRDRHDKRKRSIYLPAALLDRVEAEAVRHACSVSRIMQLAWVEAEPRLARYPTMIDVAERAAERREKLIKKHDDARANAALEGPLSAH